MSDQRPNILLIMTDQQRGDCLGIEDHPVLQTPYLDHLAAKGVRFSRAYTACPICVAARRTMMTGRTPAGHGVFSNHDTDLPFPTLPGELARAGYQSHLVGKLHLWPKRKLHGFCSADWADSPAPDDNDYYRFLRANGVLASDAGLAHGADQNGWASRPWHLPEHLHFTNWCAEKAIEFLQRRDPTVPFFLNVSFHQPHQPCTPPQAYWDRYMNMELDEPYVGEWARVFDGPVRGQPVAAWRVSMPPQVMRQYRAGYYGGINHIDDQVGRILKALPKNTVVVFCSDHGEMLGDHQWIRKRSAFEPSARIPMLMNFPEAMGIPGQQVRSEPVELMDIMPTLLEVAGAEVPPTVQGRSVLGLLAGRDKSWRPYVHGECAVLPTTDSGMQYLTDGRRKYIWYPGTGHEQFFDLQADPREMHDLIECPQRAEEIGLWRGRMVAELTGRAEGFTDGQRLTPIGGPSPAASPHLLAKRLEPQH